ncbi:hypothetical protein AVEN_212858-1 [Araneus ventricosus]|uniref:Uncharacterized protein n=1 Tax=Araneus ventricosus TaxID=182803 RepID=A0A4Y2KSF5_ARAVE|nr:hypothetical protein AVEN_212858-1 [Araneus ventricosus]
MFLFLWHGELKRSSTHEMSPVPMVRVSAFHVRRWRFIAGRNSTHTQSSTTHWNCTEPSSMSEHLSTFLRNVRATPQTLDQQRFCAIPRREGRHTSSKAFAYGVWLGKPRAARGSYLGIVVGGFPNSRAVLTARGLANLSAALE